jgi:hypothetical protein
MTNSDEYPACYNDELRLMGQRGDDESDMEADRAELFGTRAPPPINIADDGDSPSPDAAGGGDLAESLGSKRIRSTTSKVWDDFDALYEVKNGKRVRIGTKCKHCSKLYSGKSTSGIGHLHRHLPKCPTLLKQSCMAQSQLKFKPDGSLHLWQYDSNVARTQLCRLIARLDLPLCIGEFDAYEEYIQTAHNPCL